MHAPIVPPAPSLSCGAPCAAGASDEDGTDRFLQVLQAVLAQHTSIVGRLRAENRRLQETFAGDRGGHAEVADIDWRRFQAADANESPWEVSAPGRPNGVDRPLSEQPLVRASDGVLDTEEEANVNTSCCLPAANSELVGSSLVIQEANVEQMTLEITDICSAERVSSKQATARSIKSPISAVLRTQQEDLDMNVGKLERCVTGPFDKLCNVAIVLNVALIFMQLQYQGLQKGIQLGLEIGEQWPDVRTAFSIIEHLFNVFFGIELCVRMIALRRRFFLSARGIEMLSFFDSFLVIASCFDLYLSLQGASSGGVNLNVLRPFRFIRLLRTLRILRTVRVFDKLSLLVNTVAASFMALFWSIALLAIVMLMAALFLCQSLSSSLEDEQIALDTRLWIFRMYGTATHSFYTVFELTFSGGWPNYARTLVEEVHAAYSMFFFAYIIVVTFAMFRVITALFLRDTLAAASSDAEIAVQEKMKQKESYADRLLDFFHAADTSKDGLLTLAEFEAILMDDGVRAWLSVMEVDVHDTAKLFKMLDTGDGMVSPDEFVEGILQLKGHARSQDVLRIMRCCHQLMKSVSLISTKMGIHPSAGGLSRLGSV